MDSFSVYPLSQLLSPQQRGGRCQDSSGNQGKVSPLKSKHENVSVSTPAPGIRKIMLTPQKLGGFSLWLSDYSSR